MNKAIDFLIGKCSGSCILSCEGIVWYSSPGFYTNPEEFKRLKNVFDYQGDHIYDGILFQGTFFVVSSNEDDMVIASTHTSCLVIVNFGEFYIFAYDENKIEYSSLKKAVTELAEKIKSGEITME